MCPCGLHCCSQDSPRAKTHKRKEMSKRVTGSDERVKGSHRDFRTGGFVHFLFLELVAGLSPVRTKHWGGLAIADTTRQQEAGRVLRKNLREHWSWSLPGFLAFSFQGVLLVEQQIEAAGSGRKGAGVCVGMGKLSL